MSRCDYEGVFYRVFCIGLLVIALTFTVILTNVFIDIDGLLSRKEHEFAKQDNTELTTQARYDQKADIPDYYSGIERNYDDIDGGYRTKRSLDSPKLVVHIKSHRPRHALTRRLFSLLSELDKEDITRRENNEFKEDLPDVYVAKRAHKAHKQRAKENKIEITSAKSKKEEITDDILHLAIHNILLQGIVKHVDTNVVYDKVHAVVHNFKNEKNKQENKDMGGDQATKGPFEPSEAVAKVLDELTHCKKLENDIKQKEKELKKQETQKTTAKYRNFFIKTYINLPGKNMNKNSKENIPGVIKLIYNGQSIKVKNVEEFIPTTKANPEETTPRYITKDVEEIAEILKEVYKTKRLPKIYLTTMLQDVLNKLIIANDTNESGASKSLRHKRHVKLHKKSKTHKKDDDEVFVEIETHFDAKERKGKKKKELIKQLIEKILKALHSNGKEKKHKRDHVTKRIQNPLNLSNHIFDDKYLIPYDISMYTHRELHPISKVAALQEPLPDVGDKNGDEWRRKDYGPKFFSPSKSINSAEIHEVEVGFSKVLQVNDVPQRLQIPLNSDLSDENINTYLDLGRLQYLIKDLEGTGFSVGLNQYVDQIPDSESIRLFTGLEKLIKMYHQYYDQGNYQNDDQNNDLNYDQNYNKPEDKSSDIEYKHEIKKRDVQIKKYGQRFINKKSVRDNHRIHTKSTGKINDYHSNEYKIIFEKEKQPYNKYAEIFENKHKRTLLSLNNNSDEEEDRNEKEGKGAQIDFNKIMEKKLKPSEIFILADLLNRKKRSYNFHKISNLKTNIKVKRYINTNTKAKPKPKIMLSNKRNKRQIDKVRIITKDLNSHSDSDENVYIFSNENVFADRTLMRHEGSLPDENKSEEHEVESVGGAKPPVYSVYEEINPLISKYPHIFVDDFTISKFTDDTPTVFGRVLSKATDPSNLKTSTETEGGKKLMDDQMPKVQDLVRALEPHTKTNYKFTIKLIPEDKVNNRSKEGFKEVHTSINKTFNRNGIRYSTSVNVSEISKIENKNRDSKMYDDYESDKNGIQSTTEKCCLESKAEEVTKALKEPEARSGKLNKQNENIKPIILNDTRQANSDLMDILLPLNPPRTIRFSKDALAQLLIKTLQVKSPTTPRVTTKKPEVVPLETTPKEVDPLKLKLLKAISQNERLTNLVLTKIDHNTGLLETFLNKVIDKIQSNTMPNISPRVVNKIEPKGVNHPVPLQVYTRRQSNIETGPRLPFPYIYTNNHQNKTEHPVVVTHEYVHPGSNKKARVLQRIPFNENFRYFVDEDDYHMKRYPEFGNLAKHDEVAAVESHRPQTDTFIGQDNNKIPNNNKGQELKANENVPSFTSDPASGKKFTTLQILNYRRDISLPPTAKPGQEMLNKVSF